MTKEQIARDMVYRSNQFLQHLINELIQKGHSKELARFSVLENSGPILAVKLEDELKVLGAIGVTVRCYP
jgi:hypothetical protein